MGVDTRHLVLVGLMGSGKTTVARRVADRTGRRVVDLDAQVEATVGCSIPDLFATRGEEAFRDCETEALQATLVAEDRTVIATGGGVVVRTVNRELLRRSSHATVIWLDATPEALLARLGRGSAGRPLLHDDPAGVLRRLHGERAAWYAEVADHRIDTVGCSLDEVTDAVVAMLEAAGSSVTTTAEADVSQEDRS